MEGKEKQEARNDVLNFERLKRKIVRRERKRKIVSKIGKGNVGRG